MYLPILITLCCLVLTNAQQDFTCNPDDGNSVIYYKNKLTCPENTICNEKFVLIKGDTRPRPCVPASSICEYSCGTIANIVTINAVDFTCPGSQICNKEKLTCDVCICDRNIYKCKDGNKVILSIGFEFTCDTGFICNSNYEAPCSLCIKNGESEENNSFEEQVPEENPAEENNEETDPEEP